MQTKQAKIFQCPSDIWLDDAQPGYKLYNNIAPPDAYFAISYGINADIACLIDIRNNPPYGRFTASDIVNVYHGPNAGGAGQPLNARLDKVYKPSETLLFADCGTRPIDSRADRNSQLDYQEMLYYTTNWNTSGPTLKDTLTANWLSWRIPFARHGRLASGNTPAQFGKNSRINIAFCDGHAETVLTSDFGRVRVSPYR